ncbi:CoA-binding protein [Candidatus Woesearchaeota archaeon]|nr:CoA-binding protein [Candidatus Woesearchaeota archaeon]
MVLDTKHIAVVGASRHKGKIGHTILKQLLNKIVYPVNPSAKNILKKKCYASVKDIPAKIDLAVVAVPIQFVISIIEECCQKNIKNIIIITSGFGEIGNIEEEKKIKELVKKYELTVIGPNCLGILDLHEKLDTLFLPEDNLHRPDPGNISLISQSGALGGALLDLASQQRLGFAKFVSYGNALDVNETDILEFLSSDKKTEVIGLYIEGLKNGKEFLKTAQAIKKPIIVLKGGTTVAGTKAALSHTGSLAGDASVYEGVFKQAGLIQANLLSDFFKILKIFSKLKIKPEGKRIQIITNGGGFGILASDALEKQGLILAEMNSSSTKDLQRLLPQTVIVKNPVDLLGDATVERYEQAVITVLDDKNVDAILVLVLAQTPSLDLNDFVKKISAIKMKKPVLFVITGNKKAKQVCRSLEKKNMITFSFPEQAVKALGAYISHYLK